MNSYLHQKFNNVFKQTVQKENINSALIAVSGGQDSLCLIRLIQDFIISTNCTIKIGYIYIDHQWKKDSKKQAKHIINYINKINHNHQIFIYQIKKITSSELKARNLRYQTLMQHAINKQYSVIITAHTQTDLVETFLYQLIRGTGLEGATSLTIQRKLKHTIKLVRPLLHFNRHDINWFCRKFCLPIWSDITNYQYNIHRNRIRHELIPYLNQYFMSHVEKNITSFIQICQIDNEYIKQNSIKLYLKSRHKKSIALNCAFIKPQHLSLKTRTLQIFFYHNFNKCINQTILNELLFYIQNSKIHYQHIRWKNLIIHLQNNWLYIH